MNEGKISSHMPLSVNDLLLTLNKVCKHCTEYCLIFKYDSYDCDYYN